MSEYSRYDFSESLGQVDLGGAVPTKVIRAWGGSTEGYGEWSGGFVMKLSDGRYAYLSGWCDTSGWGCQDGAEVRFAKSVKGLRLDDAIEWDEDPSDLNKWIKDGMKSDDRF